MTWHDDGTIYDVDEFIDHNFDKREIKMLLRICVLLHGRDKKECTLIKNIVFRELLV